MTITNLKSTTKWLFLGAAIVGMLPLKYFVLFLLSEGFNVSLFFTQIFQTNASAVFALDVFLSSISLWLFVFIEGRRRQMKRLWVYVLCTMFVGVSLALPLFLFFREPAIQNQER